jgi:hypothetical protein
MAEARRIRTAAFAACAVFGLAATARAETNLPALVLLGLSAK